MYWQIGLLLADIGRCLEIKISRGLLRCSSEWIGQCHMPGWSEEQTMMTSTLFCIRTSGQVVVRVKNPKVTLWHYSNTSTMKNRHMPRPRRCNIPHPNPTPRLSSPAILFTQSSDRHSYSSCCSSPLSPPSPTNAQLTISATI